MFKINLKILREENNISQKQLAEMLGVSQSTVGNWESGTREPNFSMVSKISDIFGVSTDSLLRDRFTREELNIARQKTFVACENDNSLYAKIVEKFSTNMNTLRCWLKGKTNYFDNSLYTIAEIIGISLNELIGKANIDNINEMDEFSYAMYNESKNLSQEDKERLLQFAKMLKESMNKDTEKNGK